MIARIRAIGVSKLTAKLDRATRGEFRKATMHGIGVSARQIEKRVKVRFSGQPIKVRSGHTRASIRTELRPARLEAVVGSPVRHIGVLEDGATIKPVTKKVLTIPLPAARTKAGKSRGGARQVGARYEASFWKKSKRGNLILFGKQGRRLTPLFLGIKRVVIKGRHVFGQEAARAGATLVRNIERELRRTV